nr:hypothetical protein [Mycoplasmopsis bovis]
MLAAKFKTSPDAIRASVLGEHGATAMIAWSTVKVGETTLGRISRIEARLLRKTTKKFLNKLLLKHSTFDHVKVIHNLVLQHHYLKLQKQF